MDPVDRSLKNDQSHSRAELKAGKLLALAEATLPEDRSARLDFLRQLDSVNHSFTNDIID
ncbi:MAG: hypothetical protein KDD70_11925 [Bdellovibrionales bacterium]|nr:hypothetical protein [Bdellovibrionales bacterium]